MRYTREKSSDWVEFKSGFWKLGIAKAVATSNSFAGVAEWLDKCEFVTTDDKQVTGPDDGPVILPSGSKVSPRNAVELSDWLNFRQWDWLSAKLLEWARDEAIDPEV